jgi:hypothetical protein
MATLRNTAISLLRLTGIENITQRLRHHARDPETILNPLLTCRNTTMPGPWRGGGQRDASLRKILICN